MKLKEIAERLELETPASDCEIVSIMPITEADTHHITYLENPKYLRALKESKAGAVLIDQKYADGVPEGCVPVYTDEPHLKMAVLSRYFAKPLIAEAGKEAVLGEESRLVGQVYLGKNVRIGERVTIMHGSFIGDNVTIGDDVIIHPNVSVYNDSVLGDRVILHAGAVIGSDGFGYAHTKRGEHVKIHHIGNCVLEEDVEIGANTTIDRAVFGTTLLKKGTKIDNLVQVGHNCEVGENVILVSQSGLSGSCKLGRNVIMGGQAGARDHIRIGDFAMVAARGGVSKNIEGARSYSGYPLMEHKKWLKLQARINKLLDE